MKAQFVLSLPALALAYPGFSQVEERQLSGLLAPLLNDVEGLLGSVAASVDPSDYRPEHGYDFKAPGPNDSRGPCPGLNLLANHGYLPRNGHVSLAQVVEATSRGFNMGTDLSTILSVFAVLSDGDLETETWYLGSGPNHVGGLNRHDTVEADISPNREDFYNGCGDNHHLSSRLFTQNVKFAAASKDKQFTEEVMGQQYNAIASFSQKHNPYLYYFPFPSIVSLGAFEFYPNFFSNGTYGAGGVANYESISSIIGAKLNKKTGQFEYVPERWPEQGWYRRSTEYGAVTVLVEALENIYSQHPVPMPVAQLGTKNLNATTLLCNVYNGLNSVEPITLAGQVNSWEAKLSWAVNKLASVGLSETVLGCPKDSISKNVLYPHKNQKGGPLNPPPSVVHNTGNNVYYKSYFCEAPTKPQCNHVC